MFHDFYVLFTTFRARRGRKPEKEDASLLLFGLGREQREMD